MVNSEFIKTLADLIKGDDAEDRAEPRVAPWAELATSQNNPWMNAIRLHESGRYEDAYFQYMLDARSSGMTRSYARAALSFTLAADCLESNGQHSLANQVLELANWCYERQALTSTDSDIIILSRIRLGRLLVIKNDWKTKSSVFHEIGQ
jgi:hypothetical protein